MHAHGINKNQFSIKIGVDRSTITRIFNGERGWSLDVLYNIAREFGLSLDYLVTGKQDDELEKYKAVCKTLRDNILALEKINKELLEIV